MRNSINFVACLWNSWWWQTWVRVARCVAEELAEPLKRVEKWFCPTFRLSACLFVYRSVLAWSILTEMQWQLQWLRQDWEPQQHDDEDGHNDLWQLGQFPARQEAPGLSIYRSVTVIASHGSCSTVVCPSWWRPSCPLCVVWSTLSNTEVVSGDLQLSPWSKLSPPEPDSHTIALTIVKLVRVC